MRTYNIISYGISKVKRASIDVCMYILSIPTQLSNTYTYVSLAIHCYAFYTLSYPPPICSVCAPRRRCYTRKQHNIQRYDASAQPSLSPYHFFSCYNIVYMRIECDDEARRVIFVRCCSMRVCCAYEGWFNLLFGMGSNNINYIVFFFV